MTIRAVVYARLSAVGDDPDNIPDQLAKGEAHARQQGYEVVGTFSDDGKSAFKDDVVREQWDKLIDLVLGGGAEVIIARHQDRLVRNMETFGRLLNFAQRGSRLRAEFYTGGGYDFGSSTGGLQGGLQALLAWQESAVKSERMLLSMDRRRRKGKKLGGGARWFGYEFVYDRPDLPAFEIREEDGKKRYTGRKVIRIEPHPTEAALVQDAARRALRGETLYSVAKEWHDAGVTKTKVSEKTGKPGHWTGGALRQLLESPHIAGIVHGKGESLGEIITAEWPALIDRDTHERLVALLNNPGRKFVTPGSGARKHLLAGVLYCGSCGGRMISTVAPNPLSERKKQVGNIGSRGGKGRGRSYGCRHNLNPNCERRMRINAETLEMFVKGVVIDQWRSPKARRSALAEDQHAETLADLADRIAALKATLTDAYKHWHVEKITDRETYMEVKREVDAKIKRVERQRVEATRAAGVVELPDPKLGWGRLTADQRRALVEVFTPRIVIGPHPSAKDPDTGKLALSMRPYADPARETMRIAEVLQKRVRFDV